MTTYSFASFEEARAFAKKIAIETKVAVRLIRQEGSCIVETADTFEPTPEPTESRLPSPDPNSEVQPKLKRSPALMYAGVERTPDPDKYRPEKLGKKPKPLSVAAAKRGSGGKRLFDKRSIYMTGQIEPREVS